MTAVRDAIDFAALDVCHRQMQRHLADLSGLALSQAGGELTAEARQLAGAVEHFFSHSSRQHHLEEERTVFPPLLASGDAALESAVQSLQQDHGWIEENWLELAPQLRALAAGNAWIDTAEFQHNVEVFHDLCLEHIALEESLVYPEAKARWAQTLAARAQRQQAPKSP